MEDAPYRRIAAAIAARIASGELPPGARIPSTRQLMAEHGIAMATATKVLTTLREEGLVEAVRGVGTVVGRTTPAPADRALVVATAVTIADAEGLPGLSMRRLAGQLGLPTMAIYRYVADREDLILHMMDKVMGDNPPPPLTPQRDGRRACVEAIARLQWTMYRRHTWLAQAVSFTRPLPAPNAMAHTEWTIRALAGSALPPPARFTAAVTIANYVRGTAVNLAEEAQAEQDSGLTEREWMQAQQERISAVLADGRHPLMTAFITGPEAAHFSLDGLFEFGLQRLLDGLAPLL
ncbi:TetR/AcrR family transcriptional regulator C-terminal domain-containing protein [Dactylosporangium matsuzakiense]|uniref:GntR family transcriptional regulator n=1 Tax=Dactylosporangium matsuzakiense TaxID=53360 RepID=A0A9W6NLN6_9ACTN|nr:TetR/AcrR family transcriptional regulator C-terminal domain-containing protein [Dactylosporangium matsuzakiense]UWZ48303.1 TetR/AcrR family transcriptional regulator C-terminal domain-containing protein [Dactylosporangium matsuzakiense]GLL01544.1 GntR family transcriptional regulator [Dactylosporangium matsuzakiense]